MFSIPLLNEKKNAVDTRCETFYQVFFKSLETIVTVF